MNPEMAKAAVLPTPRLSVTELKGTDNVQSGSRAPDGGRASPRGAFLHHELADRAVAQAPDFLKGGGQ